MAENTNTNFIDLCDVDEDVEPQTPEEWAQLERNRRRAGYYLTEPE